MKKIFSSILCTVLMLCSLTTVCQAKEADGKHWYMPRNGIKQPTLPSEQRDILSHAAYYLDTSVTDESAEKVLYLTFDAGYENGNIEKILDTLKTENVPAAFFVLDHLILKNTDLVKRMKDEGHLVCNHTKNHKNMTLCTDAEMKKNLTDLEKIYEERTGYTMDKYFRFPEGYYDGRTLAVADELGYKTVFWSFAYADWDNGKQPSAADAKRKILKNTHNGAVLLLHPTSATNAQILGELIGQWRSMGYRFGTLAELCDRVDAAKK